MSTKTKMSTKQSITNIVPESLRKPLGNIVKQWRSMVNRKRSTTEIFEEIYKNNTWGGEPGELYSGGGSESAIYKPYAKYVADIINSSTKNPQTIIDIGCGDFAVARHILENLDRPITYIGVDVAKSVIAKHMATDYSTVFRHCHAIHFKYMDAAIDRIPDADICLIRQVLQHLSNEQIGGILKNVSHISQIIISEEHRRNEESVVPNKDIVHGSYTRLTENSGVYLEHPPFSRQDIQKVLSVTFSANTVIDTYLIEKGMKGTKNDR